MDKISKEAQVELAELIKGQKGDKRFRESEPSTAN
jgi:hypothetical protein